MGESGITPSREAAKGENRQDAKDARGFEEPPPSL